MRRSLLVFAVAVLACGAAPMDDPIAREKARLTGRWVTVDAGASANTLTPVWVSLWFTDDTVVVGSPHGVTTGLPYRIDPSQNPKFIDVFTPACGERSGAWLRGIYKLEGDKLRVTMGF